MIGQFAVCWNWSEQHCTADLLRSIIPCQASQVNINTSIGFAQTAWNDASIAPRRILNCSIVTSARLSSGNTQTMDAREEIVQAYLAKGIDCVHSLQGDYTFVLFDHQTEQLLAVRSMLSIRLLAYSISGGLYLSSDPRGLLAHPSLSDEYNKEWLAYWLVYGKNHWMHTPWKQVHMLPPGHMLIATLHHVDIKPFWYPPPPSKLHYPQIEAYCEELRNRLFHVLQTNLPHSGAIVTDTSGGMDSTSLTCLTAHILQERTFSTIHYTSQIYPEEDTLHYAQEVVRTYPSIHLQSFNYDDYLSQWLHPSLAQRSCFPLLQSIMMPTTLQASVEYMKSLQTVVLHISGEYGDHFFSGDMKYISDLWQEHHYVRWLRENWRWFHMRGYSPFVVNYHAFLCTQQSLKQQIFRTVPDWITAHLSFHAQQLEEKTTSHFQQWCSDPFQRTIVRLILEDQQPLHICEPFFNAGIEPLLPFIDQHILDFFLACPPPLLMQQQETKYLLRQAMQHILPESVLQRKDKGYATRLASAWSRIQAPQMMELVQTMPEDLQRYLSKEALISAIHRVGHGDCRDQRLLHGALAFIYWAKIG
jgi:asparagine synthase (glutamine-hydrolysing)